MDGMSALEELVRGLEWNLPDLSKRKHWDTQTTSWHVSKRNAPTDRDWSGSSQDYQQWDNPNYYKLS